MVSGDLAKDAWSAGVDGKNQEGSKSKSSSRNAQYDRMMARAETMARMGGRTKGLVRSDKLDSWRGTLSLVIRRAPQT